MLVDEHGRQVRIGVYGLAIEGQRDPAILLTRLAADEVDADFWTLPGGGLDWGEHPLDGLKREFIEETGLEPRLLMPLGIHSYSLDSEQRQRPGPSIHVIQAIYLVAAAGNPVHEVGGSTVEARWFPLTELGPVPVVELVNVALALRDALTLGSEPPPPTC
jgi:8-oxo-dGTP diphosphatase